MGSKKSAALPEIDRADPNAVREHEGVGGEMVAAEGDTLAPDPDAFVGDPSALTVEQLAANEGVQMRVTELAQYLRAHPVALSGELASLSEILLDRF